MAIQDWKLDNPKPPEGQFIWHGKEGVQLNTSRLHVAVHTASRDRNRKAERESQVYRYEALAAGANLRGSHFGRRCQRSGSDRTLAQGCGPPWAALARAATGVSQCKTSRSGATRWLAGIYSRLCAGCVLRGDHVITSGCALTRWRREHRRCPQEGRWELPLNRYLLSDGCM